MTTPKLLTHPDRWELEKLLAQELREAGQALVAFEGNTYHLTVTPEGSHPHPELFGEVMPSWRCEVTTGSTRGLIQLLDRPACNRLARMAVGGATLEEAALALDRSRLDSLQYYSNDWNKFGDLQAPQGAPRGFIPLLKLALSALSQAYPRA